MAEILSFYSVAHSQGKRTLSLGFAELLAMNEHKVLYVELDYKKPSVAISTQITDVTRNAREFFQDTILKRSFDLEPYILTKEILLSSENRDLRRVYAELPDKLDYLTLPMNFQESSFPSLINEGEDNEKEAQEYIDKFLYSLKTTKYTYIILNLPIELHSIFGFEVIANSEQIINVVTPNATRLFENKNAYKFLSPNISHLEDKWSTILNMTSPELTPNEYFQLISEEAILVPYDPARQQSEFALQLSSVEIRERLEKLAARLNIPFESAIPKKRSGFFGRMG
ncbi:hypothetical protein WMO40_20840 [Bacillaceae bacterium CLA-AA-H227]|uniref:CpsD/CapB family tyrosine-protein kinase n=2 Tax=Robertmurraya TaxID=2837507 RepID=A0A4U1CYS5_9BACI|nr:CpsD/CapB family tyrosine-protein kinase [Robertmurraya kyonggiensis]TKC15189.1 CpsD/CapB family tyrosine-protein kinase [Robertmurraya kyonggiensis]